MLVVLGQLQAEVDEMTLAVKVARERVSGREKERETERDRETDIDRHRQRET